MVFAAVTNLRLCHDVTHVCFRYSVHIPHSASTLAESPNFQPVPFSAIADFAQVVDKSTGTLLPKYFVIEWGLGE